MIRTNLETEVVCWQCHDCGHFVPTCEIACPWCDGDDAETEEDDWDEVP